MLHEVIKGNVRLVVDYDNEYVESPREWDCISKMVCFHKKKDFGDKHDFDYKDYDNMAGLKKAIIKKYDPIIIFPLYLCSHSADVISIKPFYNEFDSGQLGFVFITKAQLKLTFPEYIHMSNKRRKELEAVILTEVNMYNQYINGEIYRYDVYVDGNIVDTLGEFHDLENCKACGEDSMGNYIK